jgi:UDP-N-acetylmuramoyl-L-alanyl-D-glutamate--2,6-diaminopimelate ligase
VSEFPGVCGRCEIIPTGKYFTVICDYAHTPDALKNVLEGLRECTKGKLTVLFGCGGNRDKGKRPLMAEAAANIADFMIITSDNPRDEDPDSIINGILNSQGAFVPSSSGGFHSSNTGVFRSGTTGKNVPCTAITDRKQAIIYALENAVSAEVIVLAGKGHENYQVLKNGKHIHFDEREIVQEWLSKKS